jgi:hypothetical protein
VHDSPVFAATGGIMRRAVVFTLALFSSLVAHAADVGVSITVGQPGFYGRIEIGDYPHPELVLKQPVIVKAVVGVVREPIYLHVPPGHAKDWAKHCGKYNACGERVYFVQENWYNNVYVPQYQKKHGKPNKSAHSGKGHDKD